MTNLKEEIYNLLVQFDKNAALRFNVSFKFDETSPLENQMNALSHYWNIQLGSLNTHAILEREYLATDVDPKTWLTRFRKHVLQTIIINGLPL